MSAHAPSLDSATLAPPSDAIVDAPEVTPSPDEWARPLEYVLSLQERYEEFGDCVDSGG